MHIEPDGTVVFSTGRRRNANHGILGLAPDLTVGAGYDTPFFEPPQDWTDDPEVIERFNLTPAEQIELAEFMVAQWQAFKNRAQDKLAR